jgi:hypothetical protein
MGGYYKKGSQEMRAQDRVQLQVVGDMVMNF